MNKAKILEGLYIDHEWGELNSIKIKNNECIPICTVTSEQDAKNLIEAIKDLQEEYEKQNKQLIRATHYNALCIEAIKDFIYHNDTKAITNIVKQLEPRYSNYYTTPVNFAGLNQEYKNVLLRDIAPHHGDIFYNNEDGKFYIFIETKNNNYCFRKDGPDSSNIYECTVDVVGITMIPCYSIHQLWNFLEQYYDDGIRIIKQGDIYNVYPANWESCIGIDKDKLGAMWNAVIRTIRDRA